MTSLSTGETVVWSPPEYKFSLTPTIQTTYKHYESKTDFARQAKWCADGSCILANTESNRFQFLTRVHSPAESTTNLRELVQPSPIVEFAWFPTASATDPASFCFAASVRECPVKLLHATDGRLRASYPIIDHRERFIAPHSLAFSPTMDSLYCGFEDAIEVFDLGMPGHEGTRLHTSPSKKGKDGMKGIVSALAFTPYSTQGGYFAAGSLSTSHYNISLYDQSQNDVPLLYLGTGSRAVHAGVMQLMFNYAKPYMLYASFRRHAPIYAWDLRGELDEPLFALQPPPDNSTRTNQKLKFDIDPSGRWLAVGGPDGRISVWSLDEAPTSDNAEQSIQPKCTFQAHDDAIGSVSFHPLDSLLLSVSGSRHFETELESDSESERDLDSSHGDSDTHLEPPSGNKAPGVRRERLRPPSNDNSWKIWKESSTT